MEMHSGERWIIFISNYLTKRAETRILTHFVVLLTRYNSVQSINKPTNMCSLNYGLVALRPSRFEHDQVQVEVEFMEGILINLISIKLYIFLK